MKTNPQLLETQEPFPISRQCVWQTSAQSLLRGAAASSSALAWCAPPGFSVASLCAPCTPEASSLTGSELLAFIFQPKHLEAWATRWGRELHCPGVYTSSSACSWRWRVSTSLQVSARSPSRWKKWQHCPVITTFLSMNWRECAYTGRRTNRWCWASSLGKWKCGLSTRTAPSPTSLTTSPLWSWHCACRTRAPTPAWFRRMRTGLSDGSTWPPWHCPSELTSLSLA